MPRKPRPPATPWFSLNAAAEIAPAEERRLTRIAWMVAAAAAVVLLVLALGPHRIGDTFAETDFYDYARGARLIQHGHLDPSRYTVIGPLYEIVLALVGMAARDLFRAAELISVAAAAATLLLWFELLKRRAGARLALFAMLFMATNATFVRHGYGVMTDLPAIALQAGALCVLLAGAGGRAMASAGLLAAAAFLTRYNSIYLLPAALAAILAGGTRGGRRGRAALLFAAGFLAPVMPWVAYSLARGSGFAFQLHHNIAFEVYAHARGMAWDDYQRELQPQFKNLWDVIARDPRAVAGRMLFNVGDHLRRDALQLLGWPVAAAALLGAVLAARDGTLRRLWPLAVAGALLFATLVPVFYSQRYSLALLGFYAALAGAAFASPFLALVIGRRPRVSLKALLAVLPLAAAVAGAWRLQARTFDEQPVEVLACAQTLRELEAPGDRVIARKAHLAYYAGLEPLAFPFVKTLPELAAYARINHARWLYISRPEVETRPEFFWMLDTSAVVPGLTARRVTRHHPAVLYEIGPGFGARPAWMARDTLLAWHAIRAQTLIYDHDPVLFYRLGVLAYSMGRLGEGRRALERAAALDPRSVDILVVLGRLQLVQGDPAAALESYRRALAIAPENLGARLGLGWARLASRDLQGAASAWRPLIRMTHDPATLERMGAVFHALGDREAEAAAAARWREVTGR